MPSISARNISVSTAPAPDSAAKPCHYAECAAAAGVVTTAGLVEKSLSQLWRPFASLANVLGMANSFRSWWPRRWRVLNSWRARVIAAIVFCTTLIAGTAALIKNIQIIKEFVGIGKRQLRALRSMPEQQILSLTQTQMLDTSWLSSHRKSGTAPLHGCKFEGWLGNFGARLDYLPYESSFSMPSGNFAQEMAIWLFRPNYMMGEYDGRLILSCDQAVSAPLTFPSHMPR
jgi:hypothetical protein